MTDPNLPQDRFAWLGSGPAPDNVVVPVNNFNLEIIAPNQGTSGDGLGIFMWLMRDEEEDDDDTLSGCSLLDGIVYMEVPRGDN